MIIDRRVACISSNNIQDRVNLEMNLHIEGPIVDAFYDMALLSWAEAMDPPFPLLSNPRAEVEQNGRTCFEEAQARKGGRFLTISQYFAHNRLYNYAEDMDKTSDSALPAHPGMSTVPAPMLELTPAKTQTRPSPRGQ